MVKRKRASTPPPAAAWRPKKNAAIDSIEESSSPPPAKRTKKTIAKRNRVSTPLPEPSPEPEEDSAIDPIEISPSPPPAKRAMMKRASKPSPEPSPELEDFTASEPSTSPPPAKRAKKTSGKGKVPAKKVVPKKTKPTEGAGAKKRIVQEYAPAGFKTWKTSTKLVSGGKLSTEDSQFNVTTSKFWQDVKVENSVAFSLKPLTITEGPLKGRHVLVLEPVTHANCFRFLDLPPELRGMIYDLLLQEPEGIAIRTHKPVGLARRPVRSTFRTAAHKEMQWDKLSGKWIGQKPSNFSLLRVNRQIRDEAAAVAYGNHAFNFSDMAATVIFLETIGSMRKHLRHIGLYLAQYKHGKAPRIFSLLKDAEGLCSLRIDHHAICHNFYYYRYDCDSSAEVFVMVHCSAMLKALHKARKERTDMIDVRDIIKVGKSGQCYHCRSVKKKDCDTKIACGALCKDHEKHDEELAAEIRALVAKAVGIVEKKVATEEETVGIEEETVSTEWHPVDKEEETAGTGWVSLGIDEETMGTGWDSAGED